LLGTAVLLYEPESVNVLVTDEIVSEFLRPLELNENVGSEAP